MTKIPVRVYTYKDIKRKQREDEVLKVAKQLAWIALVTTGFAIGSMIYILIVEV